MRGAIAVPAAQCEISPALCGEFLRAVMRSRSYRLSLMASRSQQRVLETFHAPTTSACDPRRHDTATGRMRHAAGELAYRSRARLVQIQDVRLGSGGCTARRRPEARQGSVLS